MLFSPFSSATQQQNIMSSRFPLYVKSSLRRNAVCDVLLVSTCLEDCDTAQTFALHREDVCTHAIQIRSFELGRRVKEGSRSRPDDTRNAFGTELKAMIRAPAARITDIISSIC